MAEKYEQRDGAPDLTITQFYSFYRESSYEENNNNFSDGGLFERSFHSSPLPLYIFSKNTTKYVLRKKEAFWRTFHLTENSGEKFYYQQVVLNKPVYKTTYIAKKGSFLSWRGNRAHDIWLVNSNLTIF